MDTNDQRIAIAEVCGWKVITDSKGTHNIPPNTTIIEFMGMGEPILDLPDYLNNLNDMHEAESIIYPHWDTYFSMLIDNRYRDANGHHPADLSPARATAAQRAEAFLKTLNLWIDQ